MSGFSKLKSVEALVNRIIEHRKKCKHWKTITPCFNCHYGMLTPIEKELEEVYIE